MKLVCWFIWGMADCYFALKGVKKNPQTLPFIKPEHTTTFKMYFLHISCFGGVH